MITLPSKIWIAVALLALHRVPSVRSQDFELHESAFGEHVKLSQLRRQVADAVRDHHDAASPAEGSNGSCSKKWPNAKCSMFVEVSCGEVCPKFNYDHHGDDWQCYTKNSHNQSPIALNLTAVGMTHTPEGKSLKATHYNQPISISALINTGTTFEVAVKDSVQRILQVNGAFNYVLQQFHFHGPAEHTINGERGDLELHLVHTLPGRPADNPAYAVIGLIFKHSTKPSRYSSFFESLVSSGIPAEGCTRKVLSTCVPPLTYLLKTGMRFVNYFGSLTTPPCTEAVEWYVAADILPVDLSKFRFQPQATDPTRPQNYRNIQSNPEAIPVFVSLNVP